MSPTELAQKREVAFFNIFSVAKFLGLDVCIAGGAAVDFQLCNDIDVFVFGHSEDAYLLYAKLAGQRDILSDDELPCYECDERGRFYKAGIARPEWSLKPIHIIGWEGNEKGANVAALLDTFDLSIHAWAVYPTAAGLVSIPNSTNRHDPIRINRLTPTTAERLVKLTQRYFPPIDQTYAGIVRSTEPMKWRRD